MWGDSKVTITLQISREPNDILEDQSEDADPPASFSVTGRKIDRDICRLLYGFGDNELHTSNLQTKQRKI